MADNIPNVNQVPPDRVTAGDQQPSATWYNKGMDLGLQNRLIAGDGILVNRTVTLGTTVMADRLQLIDRGLHAAPRERHHLHILTAGRWRHVYLYQCVR